MAIVELRSWSVQGDPYTPPEQSGSGLVGRIYGAVEFLDGTEVSLARVGAVDGAVVTTRRDGKQYRLVDPDPKYLEWLKAVGLPFDPENPFKIPPSDAPAELSSLLKHTEVICTATDHNDPDGCSNPECWKHAPDNEENQFDA
jgi:hypothetical protein